jgi:hypothetical protein
MLARPSSSQIRPTRPPTIHLGGSRVDVRDAVAMLLGEVGLAVTSAPGPGTSDLVELRVDVPPQAVASHGGGKVVAGHFGVLVRATEHGLAMTDCSSAVQVYPVRRTIEVLIYPEVVDAPTWDRRNLIILYSVLTLFRYLGFFAIHAGAVVSAGSTALLIGESGCGKSTLACSLARCGWDYLADDSLLLGRDTAGDVVAWPLRRSLVLKEGPETQGLPGKHRVTVVAGRDRLLVEPEALGVRRAPGPGKPALLVFPTVVDSARSSLAPRDRVAALHGLLHASSITDLEPSQSQAHVELLTGLLRQCPAVDMAAGRDVLDDPAAVSRLLAECLDEATMSAARKA